MASYVLHGANRCGSGETMKLKPSPLAILFDMDGVLLHSNGVHEKAFQIILEPLGLRNFSYASIAGMRTEEALTKLLDDAKMVVTELERKKLAKAKSETALQLLKETSHVAPDCKEVLSALKERYRMALATSASQASMDLFLEMSRTGPYFQTLVHGGSVKNAKPDPEIYLLAATHLGLSPEKCLVIEDSASGVLSANRAGMACIQIGDAEMGEGKPVAVVSTLTQLLELL